MNKKNKEIALNVIESTYKSTIGQLPVVGTVFNELAFDYSGRLKQQRLNTFTEKLKDYFESIGEDEIDIENILTEDFHDMFEAILKKVSLTQSEAKLERFKNIIVGQLKTPSEFESVERYVEITGRLTEKQMAILYSYYTNAKYRDECDEQISNLKLQQQSAEDRYDELNEELQKLKENLGYKFTTHESEEIDSQIEELNNLIRIEFDKRNNTSNEGDNLTKKMNDSFGGKTHEELELSKSEFDYLLNDLSSMFLLEKKLGDAKWRGTMSYYILTSFGKGYVEFVEAI
ncbi:MAG: hypothetical protein QNK23_14370 [Crocinitomicaceae bacterium]|nr:hypothetical protein [Crocinitomicaceae bacterium]